MFNREFMNFGNTHWRQLCPSILEMDAELSISKISHRLLSISITYVPSPKSCHWGSIEEEESE